MKINQILMCAVAAGAMAFVSDQAQATVIGGNLYIPLNIKATVSYVKSGKITKATITSKTILDYEGYAKGTQLAVGPDMHVYAIGKVTVIDDLTTEGYFIFSTDDLIDVGTMTKYNEAGTAVFDFYSDSDSIDFQDNDYAFELTGNYTYSETDGAVKDGYYNQSSKFSSSNLGGFGYDWYLNEGDNLPLSGSLSGSASGKVLD